MALPRIPDAVVEAARDRLVGVVSVYVELYKRGVDLWGRCPFHDDGSASFRVSETHRNWKCFGCGERGDAIDFVQQIERLDMPNAIRRITGSQTFEAENLPARERKPPPPPKYEPLPVAPEPCPRISHPQLGNPDAVYHYRNAEGATVGYACRFEFDGGKKEVLPLTWATATKSGRDGWHWTGMAKPRPLYGLELLAARPGEPVIVVEGEKTADAARELAPWAVAVTWPGGTNGIAFVDWAPLAGRRVLLWPDADDAGHKAMYGIAALLFAAGCEVWKLEPYPDAVKGWDAADAKADGWTADDLRAFIGERKRQLREDGAADDSGGQPDDRASDEAQIASDDYLEIPDLDEDGPPPDDGGSSMRDESAAPFRALGYYRDEFFFLGFRAKQIRSFSSRALTENSLMELAPLQWWQGTFPRAKGGSGAFDTKAAINWMIDACFRRGVYDPRHVRGRGAWRDAGRIVFHFGDALSVNGAPCDVLDVESRFVYQIERRLARPGDAPLSDAEAGKIFDLAACFGWSKSASGVLAAGWLALAPICGALRWRPHIWLTGNAGCGKSTILSQFFGYFLGPLALKAQGASTEAGIRQSLGIDAIPVLFDEGEQNDMKERQRMASVITMIRQSSTESGMQTLRGTVSGAAMSFHIRSMFALASIQVGIRHQADYERLSVLSLRSVKDGSWAPAEAAATWEAVQQEIAAAYRDKTMPARFFRRVLDLAPVTLRNIETFTAVAARVFGNQRDGDQYGTLIAGAYSLISSDLVDEETAESWLSSYDWSDIYELAEGDQSRKALAALLSAIITNDTNDRVTLGEAILRVKVGSMWDDDDKNNDLITRYGLRVLGDRLFVANENMNRAKLLETTPYAADLVGLLKRIPGAQSGREVKPVRFPGQGTQRGFTLPLAVVREG